MPSRRRRRRSRLLGDGASIFDAGVRPSRGRSCSECLIYRELRGRQPLSSSARVGRCVGCLAKRTLMAMSLEPEHSDGCPRPCGPPSRAGVDAAVRTGLGHLDDLQPGRLPERCKPALAQGSACACAREQRRTPRVHVDDHVPGDRRVCGGEVEELPSFESAPRELKRLVKWRIRRAPSVNCKRHLASRVEVAAQPHQHAIGTHSSPSDRLRELERRIGVLPQPLILEISDFAVKKAGRDRPPTIPLHVLSDVHDPLARRHDESLREGVPAADPADRSWAATPLAVPYGAGHGRCGGIVG